MKADSKIELFLSLIAYSNGSWKHDEVINAYQFLKREVGDDERVPKLVSLNRPPSDPKVH